MGGPRLAAIPPEVRPAINSKGIEVWSWEGFAFSGLLGLFQSPKAGQLSTCPWWPRHICSGPYLGWTDFLKPALFCPSWHLTWDELSGEALSANWEAMVRNDNQALVCVSCLHEFFHYKTHRGGDNGAFFYLSFFFPFFFCVKGTFQQTTGPRLRLGSYLQVFS